MRIFIILVFIFLLVGCNGAKPKEALIPEVDTTSDKRVEEVKKENHKGIVYKSELVRMYGDTTTEKRNNYLIEVKFEPYISFEDFKVEEIYIGRIAPIDYTSNKTAKLYRSTIREAYKNSTPTFGGHYCMAEWGCGSPCHAGAIVDLKTGKVYDTPAGAIRYDYKKDSRMIIVNPPDTTGFYLESCLYCIPEIWVWDETKKEFKKLDPK